MLATTPLEQLAIEAVDAANNVIRNYANIIGTDADAFYSARERLRVAVVAAVEKALGDK